MQLGGKGEKRDAYIGKVDSAFSAELGFRVIRTARPILSSLDFDFFLEYHPYF